MRRLRPPVAGSRTAQRRQQALRHAMRVVARKDQEPAPAPMQPQARTGRAYRSLTLSTKHPVVVRRASRVYEPLRTSDEVLATLYEVLGTSYDALSTTRSRLVLNTENLPGSTTFSL